MKKWLGRQFAGAMIAAIDTMETLTEILQKMASIQQKREKIVNRHTTDDIDLEEFDRLKYEAELLEIEYHLYRGVLRRKRFIIFFYGKIFRLARWLSRDK